MNSILLQTAQLWKELQQSVSTQWGMCMALQLFREPGSQMIYAAVGYEDGTVAVWDASCPESPMMSCRLHSEPVMALAVYPSGEGVPLLCPSRK